MLLKLGSNGEDVKAIQAKLGLVPNGVFDQVTEKAIKSWQLINGLTADGIVGGTTWTKMFSGDSSTSTKITFKLNALKGHIPDSVISQIPETASIFKITNPLRLAHFLAQCGHESGGFKVVTENLNYSAKGLMSIFAKYFPTDALAVQYQRKPEMIANRVYSSRMGNGNEASGEGWKFRGRGYIQLTGKSNYQAFDKTVDDDIVANPDLVATKFPLASAAFFFKSNNIWTICDRGSGEDIVTVVTKRVNGGTIGLEERIKHFKEYYSLLK